VADYDEELENAGAQVIWVLEADASQTPGTVESCTDVMDELGDPKTGWCVGDGQTLPSAGSFDDSPFSEKRGFEMIVSRQTMEVLWSSSHGSTSGNENLDGDDVLAAVEAAVDKVRNALGD
jgi:hypothetical protein